MFTFSIIHLRLNYLFFILDTDNSKDLNIAEIRNQTNIFLKSQMTYFGRIYSDKHLREVVFRIQNMEIL